MNLEAAVSGFPASFAFPANITGAPNSIRIHYDELAEMLRFTGLMTSAQRTILLTDPSLSAVTGVLAYQDAIEELFSRPRLALKFFAPLFTAALANFPPTVSFNALADPALALRISYVAEQQVLRFVGIMATNEKVALDSLSADEGFATR